MVASQPERWRGGHRCKGPRVHPPREGHPCASPPWTPASHSPSPGKPRACPPLDHSAPRLTRPGPGRQRRRAERTARSPSAQGPSSCSPTSARPAHKPLAAPSAPRQGPGVPEEGRSRSTPLSCPGPEFPTPLSSPAAPPPSASFPFLAAPNPALSQALIFSGFGVLCRTVSRSILVRVSVFWKHKAGLRGRCKSSCPRARAAEGSEAFHACVGGGEAGNAPKPQRGGLRI